MNGRNRLCRTCLRARCVCRDFSRRCHAICTFGPIAVTPASRLSKFIRPARRRCCNSCTAPSRRRRRPAEPGEFTLRAFLAGRIDLSQAEAVLGVIDAADPRELRVALDQLAGGLSRPLQRLRDMLLNLAADIEAGFDFADEDISTIDRDAMDRQLADIAAELHAVEQKMNARGLSLHAVTAVLVGRPNVGKSSLFNALIGNRAALVADLPGTTRDYLTAELSRNGTRCRLIDTAGVPEPEAWKRNRGSSERREADGIDAAAHAAAAEQHGAADIKIFASTRPGRWTIGNASNSPAREARLVVAYTKCDTCRESDFETADVPGAIATSSATGLGIDALRDVLLHTATVVDGRCAKWSPTRRPRCRDSLRTAGQCVAHARRVAAEGRDELAAAEIRIALEELGRVVGAVYTDDLLDRIFSRFCVGK